MLDSIYILKKTKIWMEEGEKANSRAVEWFKQNMEIEETVPVFATFGQPIWPENGFHLGA